jgi:hypothetical protein
MTEKIRAIVIMLGLSWLRKLARKLDETIGQPKQWFFGVQVLQTWRGLIVGITARKLADTSRVQASHEDFTELGAENKQIFQLG